ncbi:hypothetical protein BS329_33440 [Amycolatopsis coloradensis]|uniref:Uncharacterized protein n=1 Tax=Amycolatopsis coloradensis TaxID=76021 RepID=A0A1R0KHW6_9PSEU|nr:hypothetical protein [Amycolatopsis coloradensis]OLZ45341.1 hypothetical protein BS329_33440 [Amycolatopsis coloradensis]
MEDQDVRSALQEHVSEAEPPIGLTGKGVLAAGRRSRRRRLTTAVAVAAVAAAGIPMGIVSVAYPDRSEPAATSPCGEKSPEESPEAAKVRLSCLLERAIRAYVTPADPLRLEAYPTPGKMLYLLSSDVGDRTGSVFVELVTNDGTLLSAGTACEVQVPAPTTCSASLIRGGTLVESTTKKPGSPGFVFYQAAYRTEQAIVSITSSNSTEASTDERPDPPAQRELPPLSEAQLREIALTPGLVP